MPVFICSSKVDTALLQAVSQTNKVTLFLADEHVSESNENSGWLSTLGLMRLLKWMQGLLKLMSGSGSSLSEVAGVKRIAGCLWCRAGCQADSQSEHRLIGKGRVERSSEDLQNKLKNGRAEGVLIYRNDWVSL